MKVAIAIPTTGRAAIVREAVTRLTRQTRAPDRILVVGAAEADVETLADLPYVEVAVSEKGSCRQRNRALSILGDSVDVVVFLDDDYVPARTFVAGVERLFLERPEVIGATGLVIADGIMSPGISFEEADAIVHAYEQAEPEPVVMYGNGAYGCNMAVRLSAAAGLMFDENMPLYGWQEDNDFAGALTKRGRVARTNYFAGVHLGAKTGRTSGKRLGYSQVVNPFYLVGKGTMASSVALHLVSKNIAANLGRSISPESYIDRRGRLVGNLIGLKDLLFGKAHPSRILEFRG